MAAQIDPTERAENARAALYGSLASVGSSLDSELRSRASNIHANSTALSKQQSDVVKQTAVLQKQCHQLQKVVDNSSGKLKEIGDVQNWAELIERDLLMLEETLRIVEDEQANGVPKGGEAGAGHDIANGRP